MDRYVGDLIATQMESGHHVGLLACTGGAGEPLPHSELHACKALFWIASAPISIDMVRKYAQIKSRYDIIHFHFPNPIGDVAVIVSGVKREAIVVTYHADVSPEKPFSR